MEPARRRLITAVAGTAIVAFCCFTPILVLLLAAIGLATLTPYLDYVLLPSLALMAFITWRSYRQYKRAISSEGDQ